MQFPFQFGHPRLKSRDFLLRHLRHFSVIPGYQLAVLFQLLLGLEQLLPPGHQTFKSRIFASQFLCAPVVLKDLGITQFRLHLSHASGKFFDVGAQVHYVGLGKKETTHLSALLGGWLQKVQLFLFAL